MIEVISLLISLVAMIGSILAVFLAARNQEVHVYHEQQDEDQSIS